MDIFDVTTGSRQVNLRLTPSHLLFVCNLTIFSLICDYEPFFQFFRRVVLLNGHKAYMPYLEWGIDWIFFFITVTIKFWRTSKQKMPKILKLTTTEQHPLLRIERLSFLVMENSPAVGPIHFWDFQLELQNSFVPSHQIATPLSTVQCWGSY